MRQVETRVHIYAPPGMYNLYKNVLVWDDLSLWLEPTPVLWRKKGEWLKAFKSRAQAYVKERKSRIVGIRESRRLVREALDRVCKEAKN